MVENIIHGGWTLPKVATDEIQIMCDKVKQQIEDKVKRNFEKFETKLYRCEIVNGVQYLVKIQVGTEICIHIMIYQLPYLPPLPLQVVAVKDHVTLDSPLEPF